MTVSKKELEIRRIAQAITKAITEQRLPPGTRLVEARLVTSLKANRNHVRAALQRLQLRRIVTIETNKGASIAQPSVLEAKNIFMARSILECGIIEVFMANMTQSDIALLKKHITLEKKAIAKGRREDQIRESGNFHLLLARLSGNPVLEDMLQDLTTRSTLIISLYQKNNHAQCGCDEHLALIEAIQKKDIDQARRCMRRHLDDIERSLNLDFWENKKVDLDHIFSDE